MTSAPSAPATRLSWVQPEDLLTHEFAAAADEGREIDDLVETWRAAGGSVVAPVSGTSATRASEPLRALATELLDRIAARPAPAAGPADWAQIVATRPDPPTTSGGIEPDRILGAWQGRAAGCLLGKPVEKIPREGIREILAATGRWPLSDWFTAVGLPDSVAVRWPWNRRSAPTSLAENISGMPEDDDLNFPMLALIVLERHGARFGTADVARAWLEMLPGGRVFTAERVAYRNLLSGLVPPATATYRNPYREWIGAAIRGDVYGWTNPGDPAGAAEWAWRDARLSHTGDGIYAEMFTAALCAAAVVAPGVDPVLAAGLAVLPPASRLAGAVRRGIDLGRSDLDSESCLDELNADYGHLHWVHAVNNAALTSFAIARSAGDFTAGITTVVSGGWDTDSNGATVGSVLGALTGAAALPSRWITPLADRVASTLPGFDGISFAELARRTLTVVNHR